MNDWGGVEERWDLGAQAWRQRHLRRWLYIEYQLNGKRWRDPGTRPQSRRSLLIEKYCRKDLDTIVLVPRYRAEVSNRASELKS